MDELISNITGKITELSGQVGASASDVYEYVAYVTSGEFFQDFTSNVLFWIVAAVVAIVVLGALFEGLHHAIRGLEISLLGAVFLWCSAKVQGIPLLGQMSETLFTFGIALVGLGLVLFVLFKIISHFQKRHQRNKIERSVRREYE